jgi:PelA/Pel-15E family pectate lyase
MTVYIIDNLIHRSNGVKKSYCLFFCILLLSFCGLLVWGSDQANPIRWRDLLRQSDPWYGSKEAVRMADNLLLFQRSSGGWPKNTDMTRVLSEKDRADLLKNKTQIDSTIDNGATTTEIRYLARVYTATKEKRFRKGFIKGLDYLLAAQYDNGGWPQFYPLKGGYSNHITFNDNAMIRVMEVLRDITRQKTDFTFVEETYRTKATTALEKGINCIVKCQIKIDGTLTAWCAQHDEHTFEPRKARTYELPSLSGSESVGIVRFLMGIETPTPEIVSAIESAVAWFDGPAKLTGIRIVNKSIPPTQQEAGGRPYDRLVVSDPTAPPLWARFYEIGTNRPFFCSRDGVKKYDIAEISQERRTGYSWYGDYAADLLEKDYPFWTKQGKK